MSTARKALKPITAGQRAFLERLVRVDQAGELGANYIYAAQHAVLSRTRPELKDLLQHMWDQEIHHHNTFNNLQTVHRVRPSLLTPLWKLGALGMGATTALMGKEAAMACTVAVETVIGGHYNDQLRVLEREFPQGTEAESDEMKDLKKLVSQFRDEELEHLDTAVENDAESAVPYWLLTEGIKGVCRVAIWGAERI